MIHLFLTTYIVLSLYVLPYIYIFGYLKMSEILVIFFSLLIFLIKFIVSYIISFSYYRQTNFSDHTNSFYSVCLHIYSEILYAKICGSCSRNCMEHIRVVPPKYIQYSFSNMICIFLHFFKHNKVLKTGVQFFFVFFLCCSGKRQHITYYK